jgi:signal transduction histidine kinase
MGAMMAAQPRSSVALHPFVFAVSAAGGGVLGFLLVNDGMNNLKDLADQPAAFWVLVVCLVAAESLPAVKRPRISWIATTAEAFGFAILLGWGTERATFALVIGSIVSDLLRRGPAKKVVFNAAQYALCMVAAGGIYYQLADGGWPFSARYLPAFAAAALVFYICNVVLVGIVICLETGRDFAELIQIPRVEGWPYLLIFGLAPILLIVANYNVALMPLLVLPMFAVARALKAAIEADERRLDAERAAKEARTLAAEQVQLVEAERSLVERLRASDRLKDELLATVSDELRTPLDTVLDALTTLSTRDSRLDDARRRELVAMATGQAERLKELIEQLLLASKLEDDAGAHDERPAVDVALLAGQAAAAAKVAHPQRTILLETGPTLAVRAAPEALLQVLVNVLDNAAKYSPDTTPIRLEASRADALAVLAVEDAGPGVPASDRERIFERFTRLDSGTTRKVSGVGLGLYVARQLAQALGGELLVAEPRTPGYGARFELHLPLAEQQGPMSLAPDGTIVHHPA